MGWLDGKVALVTGGGSGIGQGIVARFIEEGARVGVLERVAARAEQLSAAFGKAVVATAGDVTRLQDNKRAVEQTVRAFGQLDIFCGQRRDLRSPYLPGRSPGRKAQRRLR